MINLNINNLCIAYADNGNLHSYSLKTYGETLEELLDNAIIHETNQNDQEIDCYKMSETSNEWVFNEAERVIKEAYINREVMKIWRVG